MAKRAYDLIFACIGLLLLSPILTGIALAIRVADGAPVMFRQQRAGLKGRPFYIWKFRTMRVGSEGQGLCITKEGDPRITSLGRFLRKRKLDELPQLWNVLKGEMSFVGPRPEVLEFTESYTPEQRKVLELKPGITDVASLAFRDEEMLLKEAADVKQFYRDYCVPKKIEMNLWYSRRASLWQDSKVILRTFFRGGVF